MRNLALSEADETRITSYVEAAPNALPKEASLVQIYGPDLGRRYVVDQPSISIGRDSKNDIVLDSDNVSRSHARVVVDAQGLKFEDLGSTNGSLVNDQEVRNSVLHSGDIIKIGSVLLKFLSGGSAEALYHEEIYRMTIHDGLTDIPNRRYFDDFLEREIARAHRYQRPLGLMLFDIDHFKSINDDYGHLAGDYVLRHLARQVQKLIRREELFARYGGEEFAIVMPETTLENAQTFADKIRALIESTEFSFDGSAIPVTVSAGVAILTDDLHLLQFVGMADAALYQAKENGRNRVCMASAA